MRSSSVGIKVALGLVVAGALIVVVVRVGRQPEPQRREETSKPAASTEQGETRPAESLSRLERAQQRLQRLREARDSGSVAEKEPVHVRPGTGAVAARGVRPTMAREEGSAGGANAAAPADEEPEDDPDNIPALTHTALHDADPERRMTAVNLLSASEDVSVIPVLAEVLKEDSDPEVRMAALQSLSDFTDDAPAQVVDAAEIGLNDSDPEYRLEALGILADIGDDRARAVMEKALNDPDEEVRSMAEGILDIDQLYEPTPAEQATAAPGQVPQH